MLQHLQTHDCILTVMCVVINFWTNQFNILSSSINSRVMTNNYVFITNYNLYTIKKFRLDQI